MTHKQVDLFIGQTLELDFRIITQSVDLMLSLIEEGRDRPDDNLGSDLDKVGDFLTSRSHNHFRLEERIGACSCLANAQPGLDGGLRKVTEDYRSLCHVISDIKSSLTLVNMNQPESFDLLEQKLITYSELLKAHSEKENIFVLDAFNLEIGQMD